jgi:predicted membrane protein
MANVYTTGSGSIPSGTANTMLDAFVHQTLYPVVQFVLQNQMLSILFLLIGIALVVVFFSSVPRALIGWYKMRKNTVAAIRQNNSDYAMMHGPNMLRKKK